MFLVCYPLSFLCRLYDKDFQDWSSYNNIDHSIVKIEFCKQQSKILTRRRMDDKWDTTWIEKRKLRWRDAKYDENHMWNMLKDN